MGVRMHLENKKVSFVYFWIIWLMYALVSMTKNCYSAAMASIVSEGILTKSQTGLITALFYGVYGPLQILGGIYADKYNPGKLIKIGLIGAGIANAIIFFNQNYYVMLIVWTFNAIIQFALYPAVFKIVSSHLESEYRVKGVFYITLSNTMGMVLAYLMAAIVSKWVYNFAVSAGVLFMLTIVFHFACKWAEKYMVPDNQIQEDKRAKMPRQPVSEISTWSLFLKSGFFFLIAVTALRMIVSNCAQTLSATMLMESYEKITSSVGNVLNIFIVVSGVLGTTLVNRYVYPRMFRNEVVATLYLLATAIPPVIIVSFVGKVPVFVAVFCLCLISAILSGAGLVMSHCCAAYAKYGKNGLASGVNNALASIAITIQSYGLVTVVDYAGWKIAYILLVILLLIAELCLVFSLPMWSKFKNNKLIEKGN